MINLYLTGTSWYTSGLFCQVPVDILLVFYQVPVDILLVCFTRYLLIYFFMFYQVPIDILVCFTRYLLIYFLCSTRYLFIYFLSVIPGTCWYTSCLFCQVPVDVLLVSCTRLAPVYILLVCFTRYLSGPWSSRGGLFAPTKVCKEESRPQQLLLCFVRWRLSLHCWKHTSRVSLGWNLEQIHLGLEMYQ